jgi:hypothetical protein
VAEVWEVGWVVEARVVAVWEAEVWVTVVWEAEVREVASQVEDVMAGAAAAEASPEEEA